MAYLDLDIAFDVMAEPIETEHTVETLTKALIEDIDVTPEVLTLWGPGGGWPVVRFTGTLEELYRVVYRYADGDLDSVEEIGSMIVI